MDSKDSRKPAENADVIAHAASEASTPGANTESQYECPFCVMMRKGGCEDVFKAFMECGEKADKGNIEMADCLPQFEQLHLCMEKNKIMFDGLLQEMKDEEERNKAAAAADPAGGSSRSSTATVHQQQQQQQPGQAAPHQQQQQQSPPAADHRQQNQSAAAAAGSATAAAAGLAAAS